MATIVANGGFGIGPTRRHETAFQARLAGLLVPLLMALLPFGLARFRRCGASARIVGLGLGIGLVIFVVESVMISGGEAGWLPPWAAAWSTPLGLALLVGGTTLTGSSPRWFDRQANSAGRSGSAEASATSQRVPVVTSPG